MPLLDWFRPPRHVMTIFLTIAFVSAGALAWFAWLLLEQDQIVENQRLQERIAQAADRAAVVMQRSLADLESHLGPQTAPGAALPAGVALISAHAGGIDASSGAGLLYYPLAPPDRMAPAALFAEGEQLEFARKDLAGAARLYLKSATSGDPANRAGALARLARVRRKSRETEGALRAYSQLGQIASVSVDGIPTGLIAREGRASVFEETGRTSELRQEAAALLKDLSAGRWRLIKSAHEFHSAQARAWLGAPALPDSNADDAVRAEAMQWLWDHWRKNPEPSSRRLVVVDGAAALLIWNATADTLHAVIAGPQFLGALCREAIPSLRWALSDLEGRAVLGEGEPARQAAVLAAATTKLPWNLHVFAPAGAGLPNASPRRRLLISVFAVLAVVLFAGSYFILRAISRERSVARMQSDFVAAVSHEFRSPLTSLCHISEMLAAGRFESEDLRRKSYGVLVRDTDRLRRLVEGLLDFGRFEAGAAYYRFEPVEIGPFVRAMIADFQERVAPDGYRVELSGSTDETWVRADREALSRALWNLLDNAVKYSPQCQTVWVEVGRDTGRVSITVRDRGLGIPAHEQSGIFDKFVRGADSKALRIKGTGIGLAMVRHIIQAHGGEILLASEPGQGSRFTLLLQAAGGLT